jgi:histidyl-tRNA synthetase
MAKPSIPQGTRDFSASIVRRRNYIFSVIRNVFELYGFQPLETPAMENLETLMGKYGEEGDRLIFKILNNGLSDPKNIDKAKAGFEKILEGKNNTDVTERALKYDLTIPFARYVAMNHGQLTFPYKRYQVQPVWRADRPQKGRYREFTQCDADVVGSTSLFNEVELLTIYAAVFKTLGINAEIKINNRKILSGIAEIIGETERIIDITVEIDKVDKIGIAAVKENLLSKGFTEQQVSTLNDLIFFHAEKILTNISYIEFLKNGSDYRNSQIFQQGIKELEGIIHLTDSLNILNIKIDLSLARGLNYYTGTIIEVKAPDEVKIGSIGGGGRYDDLTSLFGVPNIPGVGISFGVDRIYDVMEELDLFPKDLEISTKVLFFNMGEKESLFAFEKMQQLRGNGIPCELYHEFTKINKQFTYAEKKNIPFVIIIGSKEIEQGHCLVKQLSTGIQEIVTFENLSGFLNK